MVDVNSAGIPPGSVIITPTELYRDVHLVAQDVSAMRADLRQVAQSVPDHESRIRALERRIWVATGAAGALAAGVVEVIRAATGS